MTNHKKGKEHWSVECKTIKAERDELLERMKAIIAPPKMVPCEPTNQHEDLLREIYKMTNDYYCDMSVIRDKIKKAIG